MKIKVVLLVIVVLSLFPILLGSCVDEPSMERDNVRTYISSYLQNYLPQLVELPDAYYQRYILAVPEGIFIKYKGGGEWLFKAGVEVMESPAYASGIKGYSLTLEGKFNERSRTIEIKRESVYFTY